MLANLALLGIGIAAALAIGCSSAQTETGGERLGDTPVPPLEASADPTAAANVQTSAPTMVDSPLAVSTRDVLSVCIETAEPADARLVVEILEELRQEPSRYPLEATAWMEQPQAELGCPPPTVLNGQPHLQGESAVQVEAPSPHRLFIYLVSEDDFSAAFGDSPFGRAGEEIFCPGGGRVCAEVTTGIYLLKLDRQELKDAMIHGLGLLALTRPDHEGY